MAERIRIKSLWKCKKDVPLLEAASATAVILMQRSRKKEKWEEKEERVDQTKEVGSLRLTGRGHGWRRLRLSLWLWEEDRRLLVRIERVG